MEQTLEQKNRTFADAGLNNSQQVGVKYGIPQSEVNGFNKVNPTSPMGESDAQYYTKNLSKGPSTTIEAASLGNSNNFRLPETPKPTNYNSVIASIPGIDEIQNPKDEILNQTQAEKTQDSIAEKLLAGYQKLTGKKSAQITAEDAAGLPQFQQQLNDINGQIKMLDAQALANQEKALQSGDTSSFAAGEAQRVGRNDAIKKMSLSAVASVLQGNIALAQQKADRAVDLEFGDEQAKIDYLAKAYEMNRDNLNREEKKRLEKQEIALKERQRLLDEAKEDKKTVLSFSAEAAKNGAPTLLISRAQSTNNPSEALAILGQYMSDPVEKQNALLQQQLLRENITGKRLENEKTIVETNAIKNPTGGTILTSQGKPLTDAQSTSLGYANRVADANVIIEKLGSQFTDTSSLVKNLLPNSLKSAERQQFEQAQRNFINAVLRKESGAAISDSEFANAKKQYFPQPGDKPETLVQKKANRELVYKNLLQSAGNPAVPKTTSDPLGLGI